MKRHLEVKLSFFPTIVSMQLLLSENESFRCWRSSSHDFSAFSVDGSFLFIELSVTVPMSLLVGSACCEIRAASLCRSLILNFATKDYN